MIMLIHYKNRLLERILIGVNGLSAAVVAASFILLYGFERPLFSAGILFLVQASMLAVFIAEKVIRGFNSSF